MSMERELKDLLKTLGLPVVWGLFDRDVGFPRISLQRIGTVSGYSSQGRADVETARVQVNIDAKSYGELISLGPAVSHLLTGYRGGSVIRCKDLSRRDGSSETGGEVVRRQMLDLQVRYRT
ncbi:hypothetical protein [Pseudophaeobacter flagellatus]|uniref:hypothetical protein n=1 Tax=Pseudophaeobacter flagellatus TaxID=2899119 RepID=UPI001E58B769|nr:hypothetical protein [Pseudophaeobacter flagellatus]MCD9148518.1 hypothetical protein [Pseudophaeobacter flagellatus]